jgi:predicted metalloprotease
MLLTPNDTVLEALVVIGARIARAKHVVSTDELLERLHRADADDVFDHGSSTQMADAFVADYL